MIVALAAPLASGETSEDARVRRAIDLGLEYLDGAQARDGHWSADGGMYPTAMTALAGMAFLLDGNTTLQGRYASNVRAAVEFVLDQARPNGLIGDPNQDNRYLYGHGFSMLFLSQVLGEEDDANRRRELVEVLTLAVDFSGKAQTRDGGWGYVSARDGHGFDEGSVTITQMQGLRGCRNAGIAVPKEIIDGGVKYIAACAGADGGVRYSLKTAGGSRPPITAAAVACLFNAGEYDNPLVAQFIRFADENLAPDKDQQSFGHWHYAHYYYAQVVYRQGGAKWRDYRAAIHKLILARQAPGGSWTEGYIGTVYTTALNLAILEIDNGYLPIYQR